MKTVGIIGLGLIGGSIAKGLKQRCNSNIVAMNRSEASLLQAYNDGVISEYSTDDFAIFKSCDIIFICTPVDKITGFVDRLLPIIKKDCIITDVGSTKKHICENMLNYKNVCFIGGHPMAGSEKTSYSAAKEYLFENAYYILTPMPWVEEKTSMEFAEIIKILGAIPIVLTPEGHDFAVSGISHVPHVIAASLVNTVKQLDTNECMHTLAAGGFKDITRIASSSAEMWSSICKENKSEILKFIDGFKNTLNEFENKLKDNDNEYIYDFFDSAKKYRDSFATKKVTEIQKNYYISLDVRDQPGAIATVATLLSVNNINIKNIGIMNNRDYQDGIMQIFFENENDREKSIKILRNMNYKVYTK